MSKFFINVSKVIRRCYVLVLFILFTSSLSALGILGVKFEYGLESNQNILDSKIQYAQLSYELGIFKRPTIWEVKPEIFALTVKNTISTNLNKTYHDISILNVDQQGDNYKGVHKREGYIYNIRYTPKIFRFTKGSINLFYQYSDYKTNIYGKNSQGYKPTTTFHSILQQSKEKDIYIFYEYQHNFGANFYYQPKKDKIIRLGIQQTLLSMNKISVNSEATYFKHNTSKVFGKKNLMIDFEIKRMVIGYSYFFVRAMHQIDTKTSGLYFGLHLF